MGIPGQFAQLVWIAHDDMAPRDIGNMEPQVAGGGDLERQQVIVCIAFADQRLEAIDHHRAEGFAFAVSALVLSKAFVFVLIHGFPVFLGVERCLGDGCGSRRRVLTQARRDGPAVLPPTARHAGDRVRHV